MQIGDADNEAERISPDEEEKNDNGNVEKPDQKREEASTKVNIKQCEKDGFPLI